MSLEARLRERIQREGPISFYEWMKAALYDERDGYYCVDRPRQGRAGDYRTAPETSPLFAATFAGYFAKLFTELGAPSSFTILELGAGAGEFAHGVLSVFRSSHPDVFSAVNYLIQEPGAANRRRCVERLAEFSDRVEVRPPLVGEPIAGEVGSGAAVTSADTITGIVFSNELFDALPVNRVVGRGGRLRQMYVGLHESDFIWLDSDLEESVADYCERIALRLDEGQIAELNLSAERLIARLSAFLNDAYLVTVDYGAARTDLLRDPNRRGGTLRSFRRHQLTTNVLMSPGEQDLTTTVDWTQLIEAGERVRLRTERFERLDRFLLAEGLLDRLGEMTDGMTEAATSRLTTGARELILPTGMAASFQVLVQKKTIAASSGGSVPQ